MAEKISEEDVFAKKLIEDYRNTYKKFSVSIDLQIRISVPVVEHGSREPFRYVRIGKEIYKYGMGEMDKIRESIVRQIAEEVEKQLKP